jgi:hypothetical protein
MLFLFTVQQDQALDNAELLYVLLVANESNCSLLGHMVTAAVTGFHDDVTVNSDS